MTNQSGGFIVVIHVQLKFFPSTTTTNAMHVTKSSHFPIKGIKSNILKSFN